MEQVDMSFAERDRANSIAEFRLGKFTVQKLPEFDRLFKSKSHQEQYEIYLFAIYDKSLPKELYQYFVQQLGSPLKTGKALLITMRIRVIIIPFPFSRPSILKI